MGSYLSRWRFYVVVLFLLLLVCFHSYCWRLAGHVKCILAVVAAVVVVVVRKIHGGTHQPKKKEKANILVRLYNRILLF
jgi:hypothetical protein